MGFNAKTASLNQGTGRLYVSMLISSIISSVLKTKRYLRQSGYSRGRGDTPLSIDPDLWIKSREFIAEMDKVMTGAATTTAMPAATSSLQVPQSQSKVVQQKKNISTSSVIQAKLGWVYVRVHVHFCVQVRPFHVHAFHVPKTHLCPSINGSMSIWICEVSRNSFHLSSTDVIEVSQMIMGLES